jgi:hypothetical protein
MRTTLLVGLFVTLCIVASVGSAGADSDVRYPDGNESLAIFLGGGVQAFILFDNEGDGDIFIHAVTSFANLAQVSFDGFFGFAYWFNFRGRSFSGCNVYDVYRCTGFSSQICNVNTSPFERVCF